MRSSLRARVVVNDLGGEVAGSGSSQTPAEEVVDEIRKAGGEAIVSDDNVCGFAAPLGA